MDADDAVRVRDAWRHVVEACPHRHGGDREACGYCVATADRHCRLPADRMCVPSSKQPTCFERCLHVDSDGTGTFFPLARRGQHVSRGQKIGYVTDYCGRPVFDAVVPESAVVLYLNLGRTVSNAATWAIGRSIACAGFALTCSSTCLGTFQRRAEAAFGCGSVRVQLAAAVAAASALLL